MSKTSDLLVESLTEIIEDMEKNGGKNLKHRTLSADLNNQQKICKDESCASCKNQQGQRILKNF